MKPKDNKRAWKELKERKMKGFISIAYNALNNENDRHMQKLANRERAELIYMDQLDGTNEFSNLLNDMGDE
jgi:hypothetical protein